MSGSVAGLDVKVAYLTEGDKIGGVAILGVTVQVVDGQNAVSRGVVGVVAMFASPGGGVFDAGGNGFPIGGVKGFELVH